MTNEEFIELYVKPEKVGKMTEKIEQPELIYVTENVRKYDFGKFFKFFSMTKNYCMFVVFRRFQFYVFIKRGFFSTV